MPTLDDFIAVLPSVLVYATVLIAYAFCIVAFFYWRDHF